LDQGGASHSVSSGNKEEDPIIKLQNSKLFGIQEELGFSFALAKEANKTTWAVPIQAVNSNLKDGEIKEVCQ
jgi:hypothetical protein